MSRRPSWVMGGAVATTVTRTPSGLPLCSTCHKELGFCSHMPIFRDRRWSTRIDHGTKAPTAVSAAAGSGAALRDADTVPSALSINATDQSGDSKPLEDCLQQGTKRRRPTTLDDDTLGKGKRRGIITHPTGLTASARGKKQGKKSSTRAKRDLRRSTRFSEEEEPLAVKRTSFASSCSGGAGRPGAGGGSATEEENLLLRFHGFEANDSGKECMCCYQVANITVNFMCEERREQAAKEAQAAREREQQSGAGTPGARAGPVTSMGGLAVDVPHVMCVDCFRVFVASRVSDRKLVTSREFDGYTVGCPMGCADSFINPACFEEIMGAAFMVKYRRFSAIHLASRMRIVWCPACHCGVVPSAAAAAATRRPSVVPAPELPRQGSNGFFWGVWGSRGEAGVAEMEQQQLASRRRRPSLCIGCPGCQASLCLSCRALHDPGVDCTAAAAAADIANAADANGGVLDAAEESGGGEAGRDGGSGDGAAAGASAGPQGQDVQVEQPTTSTKRCPRCHVPIFKDGGCNHMKCSMCQFEFCWLHLTEWIVGGDCQRGHWSSNPALNRAYNAQRLAREGHTCTVA